MKPALVVICAAAALSACATTALPPDRLASSEAAIVAATAVGTTTPLPDAALHVRLAEEAMATAKTLAKDGQAARAELFLQRSQADAELALALTREQEAKVEAAKVNEAVLQLEGSTS